MAQAPRVYGSGAAKHTFLDLITGAISAEDKHKIIREFQEKESLLSAPLLETYLSGQPLLLTVALLLAFISLTLFVLAVLVTACRSLGRCGGRRFQPHPSSSRRFTFLLLAFVLSWLLLAAAAFNFVLAGAAFWGQRNPTQLISVPLSQGPVDYPDYSTSSSSRSKRESILTSLFNDPDYNGDFENVDEGEERTWHDPKSTEATTTKVPVFVQETSPTPAPVVPIGGDRLPHRQSGTVFVTRNKDVDESGQRNQPVVLTDAVEEAEEEEPAKEGEDEEYLEGDDGEEEEESGEKKPTTTPRPTTPSNRGPHLFNGVARIDPRRGPVGNLPSFSGNLPTTTIEPRWVETIGHGDEWDEVFRRAEQINVPMTSTTEQARMEEEDREEEKENDTLPPRTTASTTTRSTTIMSTTPSSTTTTSTTTTQRPTTQPSTTTPSTTTSTTSTTTPRPTLPSRPPPTPTPPAPPPRSSPSTRPPLPPSPPPSMQTTTRDLLPFEDAIEEEIRGWPTLPPMPSTPPRTMDIPDLHFPQEEAPIPFVPLSTGDVPDYVSISGGGDAMPIPLGHWNGGVATKKGGGKAGLSLLTHRRKFESLQSEGFRSMHRTFAIILGLALSACTLPSLLLVVLGAMHYARSYHPMDRSKISDRVGVLCVLMALALLFILPLLLLHADLGLVLSHTHHALCPILQPPTDNVDEIVMAIEGCARVQTPLMRMWQSSLLAALAGLPVAILLLQLSNYFLRMRTEHYWTHAESALF